MTLSGSKGIEWSVVVVNKSSAIAFVASDHWALITDCRVAPRPEAAQD